MRSKQDAPSEHLVDGDEALDDHYTEDTKVLILSHTVDHREWGQHGDIEPENILWLQMFTNGDGISLRDDCVGSDFGLASFNTSLPRSRALYD